MICSYQLNNKEEWGMKKLLMKYGHILSAFALIVTTYVANRNCVLIFHQAKLPDAAKKLRKF